MAILELILFGTIGPIIAALITGAITWIVAKSQIRSLKEDYERQLKAYEKSVDNIISSSKENMKMFYQIVEAQEKKILDLEERIVDLVSTSRKIDQRKLDLMERDIQRKQQNENLRVMKGLGKALGII